MQTTWPLPDAEFEAVMCEIDAALRRESDRIVGRELRGWFKFCERFNLSADIADPLAVRVFDWFKTIYGDRLILDADFGKSFVIVRGDAYLMRCFRIYGTVYVICTGEVLGREIRHSMPGGGHCEVVNLLDGGIDGLTPELARRLQPDDCTAILNRYYSAFCAFAAMEGALATRYSGGDAPYVKEAVNDLLESSECILRRSPNYGQSNWAALQAAEKCVKSYILEKGGAHGKIHRLQDLVDCAVRLGLPQIAPQLIDAIQCKPDVRYNAELVSRDKALAAYGAALAVCAETAKHIGRTTAQAGIGRVRIRISGKRPIDGLALVYHPPVPPFVTKPGP